MSVLYEYFRAAGDAAAVKAVADLDGLSFPGGGGGSGVEVMAGDGLDPAVSLGKLVGFACGVDWTVDLVDLNLLWSGDEEEGPWLTAIDDGTRDALAAVTAERLPELSERLGRIEELASPDPLPGARLLPVVERTTALARRARDAGEHLYCVCCL